MAMKTVKLYALEKIPEIKANDDLGKIIADSIREEGLIIDNSDIIVIAQKIVSKAEGRTVELAHVKPRQKALKLSALSGKDPRLIELMLRESSEILKLRKGLIICRHNRGYVCANAGIDRSNSGEINKDHVVLLPNNPDQSASRIRKKLKRELGKEIAVIINDSQGRPFREGSIGIAIGFSGINPFLNYIGKRDRAGYQMISSIEALVDELSSAATLLMGQSDEGIPVVIIKGVFYQDKPEPSSIIREPAKDLFR